MTPLYATSHPAWQGRPPEAPGQRRPPQGGEQDGRPAVAVGGETGRPRAVVVGSGTRFLSGISYYTWHLSRALSPRFEVSTVLMRRLLPTALYPGRDRVDVELSDLSYRDIGPCFDGVDWYLVPSLTRATRFVEAAGPDLLILQWWTGTVALPYLVLARVAARRGVRVVIEFHEVLDTAEQRIPLVSRYVAAMMRRLLGVASGLVVHSAHDRALMAAHYELPAVPVVVVGHGPYSHYDGGGATARREAPGDAWNILFFGTIRPYKGLEHLVEAFNALPDPERYWLTVVGETWEGWSLPAELIAASPVRDRITFVNRYVSDDELGEWLAGADAVVLPYLRSSASGPLHTAMHHGLPVVVTSVGGLVEAANAYAGAVFVPPADPEAIVDALAGIAAGAKATRYDDPSSWEQTAAGYEELLDLMAARPSQPEPAGRS
jgi:glycosyltransferase involved in cell wall biosynthesis